MAPDDSFWLFECTFPCSAGKQSLAKGRRQPPFWRYFMINESVFLPEHKMNLSLQEAEAYFGIDQATLISLLTRPEYRPFFLVVGNTALVKRSPFEQVIQQIQSLPSCEGPYDMVQSNSNLNLENRINAPCAMPSLESDYHDRKSAEMDSGRYRAGIRRQAACSL